MADAEVRTSKMLSTYPEGNSASLEARLAHRGRVGALPYQLGDYRLTRILGIGGMATVYEAYRVGALGVSTKVALKVLHPELSEDPNYLQLFTREAELTSGLRHPNILQVQDFRVVDGLYFMAMEYVDGCDLSRLLVALKKSGERLPAHLVVDILSQLLRGLAWAHQATDARGALLELVHRDLKPANILVSTAGTVKIGDFGVAKSKADAFTTAANGDVKGTLSYMSPEQLNMAPLTAQSDLFSVGLILFEMLAGQSAIQAKSLGGVVQAVSNLQIPRLMGRLPGGIEGFKLPLAMALQVDEAQRYGSAEEMEDDLNALRGQLEPGPSLSRYLRPRWKKLRQAGDYATLPTQVGPDPDSRVFSPADFKIFPEGLLPSQSVPPSARRRNLPPMQAARIAHQAQLFDEEQARLAAQVALLNLDDDDIVFEEEILLPTEFISEESLELEAKNLQKTPVMPAPTAQDVAVPEPRALFGESVEALWFDGDVEDELLTCMADLGATKAHLDGFAEIGGISSPMPESPAPEPVSSDEDALEAAFMQAGLAMDADLAQDQAALSLDDAWFEQKTMGAASSHGRLWRLLGLFSGLFILLLIL